MLKVRPNKGRWIPVETPQEAIQIASSYGYRCCQVAIGKRTLIYTPYVTVAQLERVQRVQLRLMAIRRIERGKA